MPPPRNSRARTGRWGEAAAAVYLLLHGYWIRGRNARLGRYEIDIIATRGDTTVFVEVRTRAPGALVSGEDSVLGRKERHVQAFADAYINRENDPSRYYRIDIIAVSWRWGWWPTFRHLQDAIRR